MLWDWDGTVADPPHALCCSTGAGWARSEPTAAIIDNQTSKAAQEGCSALDQQGFDAGRNVTGRKRHILVDTLGLLNVVVHPADVWDRDDARQLPRTARRWLTFIEHIFAEAGNQGSKMAKVVGRRRLLEVAGVIRGVFRGSIDPAGEYLIFVSLRRGPPCAVRWRMKT